MRPTKDAYFLAIARQIATRATCIRRAVGCVIVDKNYRILSTGHNGVPQGVTHCIDEPCEGSKCAPGTGLHLCRAVHAEVNALLFCNNIMAVYKIYLTHSPCLDCVKLIMSSSCSEVIYANPYNELHDILVKEELIKRHITITHYEETNA